MLSRCKRRAGCAPVGRAREEFPGHPSQRLAFFPTDTRRVYPIPSDPDAIPQTYPPFLLELAHYEWVELVLSVSNRAPDWEAIAPGGSLLLNRPALNPVLANLSYRWPVHRIGPPADIEPAETYLLVFRDQSGDVQFTEINAYTSRLVSLLESGEYSGQAALEIVAAESRHPMPEVVIKAGLEAMRDLQTRGVLLGVVQAPCLHSATPPGDS